MLTDRSAERVHRAQRDVVRCGVHGAGACAGRRAEKSLPSCGPG